MIKVLLLDDDELANELVVYILELAGITDYRICTSGEEALKYLNKCSNENRFPDVIFVDINMPGMNGFEFVEQYEKTYYPQNPESRIIMLTNSVLASEKKQAMRHESVYNFWNKPLTHERLQELVESITNEKQ